MAVSDHTCRNVLNTVVVLPHSGSHLRPLLRFQVVQVLRQGLAEEQPGALPRPHGELEY